MRFSFSLVCLLFVTVFVAVGVAAADENAPRATAAVGTPVAAAFETVGYIAQTKMLQGMGEGLRKLGALIYICCILSALMTAGMAGRYDMALWLLIGPPVFFFMIRAGSTPGGSEWEFGKEKDTLRQRDRLLQAAQINPGEGNGASWFFHNFNLITSDIAQQLIKLFTSSTPHRDDEYFTVRQSITRDLFGSELEESELISFASSVRALCVEPLHAAQLMARALREETFRTSEEYQRQETIYCQKFTEEKDQRQNVPDGNAREFVQTILNLNSKADSDKLNSRSCKQLWSYLVQGVEKRAQEIVGRTITLRMPPAASAEVRQKILRDIVKKLTSSNWNRSDANDGPARPCPANTGSNLGGGASDEQKLQRIFSAWMIRKIFTTDFRGPILASMRPDTGAGNDQPIYGDFKSGNAAIDQTRRGTIQQKAAALPYEIYFLAQSLPYVQGIALYALAIMYPFFALLLIVPGMIGSFFMWCALWVWLKSWDVGWALVMIADTMLWDLMPHNTFFRYTGSPSDMDPPNVLEAAFTGDYAYNLMTYYSMLALMIGAVPIISANAILGAKRSVAGIMLDGFKTMASTLSSAVEDNVRTAQLTEVDRAKTEFMAARVNAKVDAVNAQQVANRDQYEAGAATDMLYQRALTSEPASKLSAFARTMRAASDAIKDGDLDKLGKLNEEYAKQYEELKKDKTLLDSASAGASRSRFADTVAAFQAEGNLTKEEAEAKTMRYMMARLDMEKALKANDAPLQGALAAVRALSGENALTADQIAALEAGVTDDASKTRFDAAMTRVKELVDKKALDGEYADILLRVKGDKYMNSGIATAAEYTKWVAGTGKADEFKRDANGYLIDPLAGKSQWPQFEQKDLQALSDFNENVRITRQLAEGAEEFLFTRALKKAVLTSSMGDIGTALALHDVSQGLIFRDLVIAYQRTENYQSQAILELAANYYNFEAGRTQQWHFTEMVRAGLSGRNEHWNVPDAPYHLGPTADTLMGISSRHLEQYGLRAAGFTTRSYQELIPGGSVPRSK